MLCRQKKKGKYFKCIICSKEFYRCPSEIKRGSNRFCSHRCAHEHSKEKVEITCKNCNKRFTVRKYRKESAKFCSKRCLYLGRRNREIIECYNCGKELQRQKSWASKGKYNFCSKDCWLSYQKKHGSPRRNGDYYNCATCGESIYRTPKDHGSKNFFCSRNCMYNYQFVIYPKTHKIRQNVKKREWHQKLRDSYIRGLIRQQVGITNNIIPKELIDTKRVHLKIKRELNNRKQ